MHSDADHNDELNRNCAHWLRDIARGDQGALSMFYDATLGKCYALAIRITRTREAAEEVVSDTYTQVWREAARYDAVRGRPLAWLLSICRSRAIDHIRQKDRAESHADPASLMDESLNTSEDPLELTLTLESNTRLHAAIAQLPKIAQQLLALAFFRGLSHQEIADHTGMPLGSVKTHLRRAQECLRADLSEKLP